MLKGVHRHQLMSLVSLSTMFFSMQLMTQGVSFVSGLLSVNLLTYRDLSLISVVITMLGSLTLLSNAGITPAINSIGGRVHADRPRFARLLQTALRQRWLLFAIVAPCVTAVLIVQVHRLGVDALSLISLVGLLLACAACELHYAVMSDGLLLLREVRVVQEIDVALAVLRLWLLIGLCLVHAFTAIPILYITLLCLVLRNRLISRAMAKHVHFTGETEPEDRRAMVRFTLQQGPNLLFYIFHRQLPLLLLSLTAHAQQVAELSALNRLSLVLTLIYGFLNAVLVPGFARLQERSALRQRYVLVLLLMLAISAAVMAVVMLMPHALLWVLGPKYADLDTALRLLVVQLLLEFLAAVIYALNAAKGWIRLNSLFYIATTLPLQGILMLVLPVNTLVGVIELSIVAALPNLILCACDAFVGLQLRARLDGGGGAPPPAALPAGVTGGGPLGAPAAAASAAEAIGGSASRADGDLTAAPLADGPP